MKGQRKNFRLSMVVILCLMLVLTACGGNSGSNAEGNENTTTPSSASSNPPEETAAATSSAEESDPVDAASEINFMGWGGDNEKAVFQKLTDSYMKKYPNKKVKYTVVPPPEYYQKLDTLIAANQAPDVFYAGGAKFKRYASSGVLLNLTPFTDSTTALDPSNIWRQALDRYRFDGTHVGSGDLYGLPKDVGPWAFVYNKDLFDKAGLPHPSAKAGEYTWNDMLDAAKKLTVKNERGKIDQFGIAGFSLEAAVWGNGGDWVDTASGKITIDDPKFTEAFQFVADLNLVHHVSPSADDEKAQNGYARFLAGKIAMFPMGPWDQPAFWKLPFNWDIAAWPASPNTGKTATWLGSMGFAVSAKTEYPEDAFRLAAFYSVDRDAQKENMELGQAVPNLMDMAKGDFLKMDKPPATRQVFLDIIEDYGRPTLDTNSKDTKWIDTFWQEASRVWTGKQTAADWAKEMQPKIQKLYDDGNK